MATEKFFCAILSDGRVFNGSAANVSDFLDEAEQNGISRHEIEQVICSGEKQVPRNKKANVHIRTDDFWKLKEDHRLAEKIRNGQIV